MELILVLVLLWMGQGVFIAQAGVNVALAVIGALIMGVLQLAALWFFRRTLPQQAVASIRVIPQIAVLVRWTLFTLAAGGIVQAASLRFVPTADLPLQPLTQHWAGWAVAVLIAPLVEEILFRACVFELLRPKFPTTIALLISAAIFGFAHGSLVGIAFAFCGGLIFGFAYLRSGSILPGFIGHAAVNVIGLLAIRNGAV